MYVALMACELRPSLLVVRLALPERATVPSSALSSLNVKFPEGAPEVCDVTTAVSVTLPKCGRIRRRGDGCGRTRLHSNTRDSDVCLN